MLSNGTLANEMTMNDLRDHFCCLKSFYVTYLRTSIIYDMLTHKSINTRGLKFQPFLFSRVKDF